MCFEQIKFQSCLQQATVLQNLHQRRLQTDELNITELTWTNWSSSRGVIRHARRSCSDTKLIGCSSQTRVQFRLSRLVAYRVFLWRRISEVTERRVHTSWKRCPFSRRRNSQYIGDFRITQLDWWKRVPQARSRGCKSSVAITTECLRHHVRPLWTYLKNTTLPIPKTTALCIIPCLVEMCFSAILLVV